MKVSHPQAGELRVTGPYSEDPVALTPAEFSRFHRLWEGKCGRRVVVRIVLEVPRHGPEELPPPGRGFEGDGALLGGSRGSHPGGI